MTEIDVAMEAEWMHRHQSEQADVEDEGKAFFAFEVNRTLQSSGFTVNLRSIFQAVRRQLIGRFSHAP